MKLSVTGGIVSVEDGTKKPEEYAPPKKVRVELHFDVPGGEDADAHIGAVASLAQAHVAGLLGGKPIAPELRTAKSAITTGVSQGAPAPGSKAALEAEALARMNGGQAPSTAPAAASGPKRGRPPKAQETSQEAAKPAPADPDELTPSAPATAATAAQAPAADDLSDLTGETPKATSISDAELNSAAAKRNGVIKSGVAIRKLVGKFMPDPSKPPQLAMIPQDKRAQFLKELEVLQAE